MADDAPEFPKELSAFFDRHRTGTADQKRAAHDALAGLIGMVDEVDTHLAALQSDLTAAELSVHDRALDNTMNWVHTRLKRARANAAAFRDAGRALAQVLNEVEGAFDRSQIDSASVLTQSAKARAGQK